MTQDELKQILFYCAITGCFTWLVDMAKNVKVGDRAGTLNKSTGYRIIRINGKNYLEHRLAWLYVHGVMPSDTIDHINRIRDDNRIDNLRLATKAENLQNLSKSKRNNSGFMGVSFYKRFGKWRAQIMVDGKQNHLGYYDTPEEAHQSYLTAKAKLHTFHPL